MRNYIGYLLLLLILFSCGNKSKKDEFWPDGSVKIKVKYEILGEDTLLVNLYYRKGLKDLNKFYYSEKFYNNGQVESMGNYDTRGKKSGTWKFWYKNGNLAAIENYKNGELNGYYRSWLPDGAPNESFLYVNGVITKELK